MRVCLSKQDTEGFYILWGGGEDEYEYHRFNGWFMVASAVRHLKYKCYTSVINVGYYIDKY